jgi:hypothetical protein
MREVAVTFDRVLGPLDGRRSWSAPVVAHDEEAVGV